MNIKKYLLEFENYLKYKNFSNRTIETYCYEINKFNDFLNEHYLRIDDITKITKDTLKDYSYYILEYKNKKGRPYVNKTKMTKISALKKFFKFLLKSDYILKDPSTVLEPPRSEITLPRVILTEKEMKQLIDSVKTNTPIGLRNKAVIELFYSTGIRTSELCNSRISDLNLEEMTLLVFKGKGNKSRIVPLTQYACFYIEEYLNKARKFFLKGKKEDSGHIFLSRRGNPLTKDTINSAVIAQAVKNSGIKKHVSCYIIRHTIASHLVKNNVDIKYVGELLGHASLRNTQIYCHLNINDLKKAHAQHHPRNK